MHANIITNPNRDIVLTCYCRFICNVFIIPIDISIHITFFEIITLQKKHCTLHSPHYGHCLR